MHRLQGGDLHLGEVVARVALGACPEIVLGVDDSFDKTCEQPAVHHPQSALFQRAPMELVT